MMLQSQETLSSHIDFNARPIDTAEIATGKFGPPKN